MKCLYKILAFLLIFCYWADNSFCQTIKIEPSDPNYSSSAPPEHPTGIGYRLVKKNSSNITESYDYTKCRFTYNIEGGIQFAGNSTPTISGSNFIAIVWSNFYYSSSNSSNGRIVVSTSNRLGIDPDNFDETCPLGNVTRELVVPIRYIGELEQIKLNGTAISTTSLPCGNNSVTFSIPAPLTKNPDAASINYTWTVPTDWTITSGQGTNTIQVTPSAGSNATISVQAKRNDAPYVVRSKAASITRPGVGLPTLSFVDLVCSGQTQTATVSANNATGYEWTSNGGIYVNGSQNAGIIGSSAGISGTAAGSYTVRGYSAICQTYSSPVSRSVEYGLPAYPAMYVNGQPMSNGYFCAGTLQNLVPTPTNSNNTYSWYLNQGNPSTAYLTSYGATASFNSYVNDCYGIGVYITNACGTISTGISLCAQNCFAKYTVFPNPVKDYINVEFENVENTSALPDEILLLSEKSTKAVKYANVQEIYSKEQLKEGKKIEINVSELPRGTYYLHIKNSRKKGEELDVIRVILE